MHRHSKHIKPSEHLHSHMLQIEQFKHEACNHGSSLKRRLQKLAIAVTVNLLIKFVEESLRLIIASAHLSGGCCTS